MHLKDLSVLRGGRRLSVPYTETMQVFLWQRDCGSWWAGQHWTFSMNGAESFDSVSVAMEAAAAIRSRGRISLVVCFANHPGRLIIPLG